jgi:SAM-dependent methyltransferase
MKNAGAWRPSKFILVDGRWRPSSDPHELRRASRLLGSILCELYPRLLKQHVNGRLLDHGCGKVPLYGMYRGLVTEAVCIDWSTSLHGTHHVDQLVDLNGPLPFPAGSFDTVLSNDVMEHIKEPELAWSEMARVLRPNGKLIVSVPFLYGVHEAPHDYHRFTAFKLKALCDANGLRVLELQPYGGGLEVVLDIVGKHLDLHPVLSTIHLAIARLLRWFGPIRRVSERRKDVFPMGYSMVAQKPPSAGPLS